jgi:hypothetical protein
VGELLGRAVDLDLDIDGLALSGNLPDRDEGAVVPDRHAVFVLLDGLRALVGEAHVRQIVKLAGDFRLHRRVDVALAD